MFNPTDVLDRDLYYKTPVYSKMLTRYLETYGKKCTYYINPNNEAKENESIRIANTNDVDVAVQGNVNDSHKRLDNYTLAYGKDLVGYDFSKLQKVPAVLYAEYRDYYVHDIGAEDSVSFMLSVKDTPVSRGDIISYEIQDKQIFYRINDKVNSYQEIIYRINCKLIQVKQLGKIKRVHDIIDHDADYYIRSENGVVL